MKQHTRQIGVFLLALLLMFGVMVMPASAADVALKVGESKELVAGESSSPYTWKSEDTAIAVVEQTNQKSCKVTAVGPGTVKVTASYTKLEWDGNKGDIWGNVVGDFVPRSKSSSWTVVVTSDGTVSSSGAPKTQTKTWSDPLTFPEGTVGEDVLKTIDGIWRGNRSYNMGLIPVKRNDLWGYADRSFKLVIPFQFASASEFSDSGLARVKVDTVEYLINTKGEYMVKVPSGYNYSSALDADIVKFYAPAGFNGGSAGPTECYDAKTGERTTIAEYNEVAGAYAQRREAADPELEFPESDTYRGHTNDGRLMAADAAEGLDPRYKAGTEYMGALDVNGNIVIPFEYKYLSASSGGYMAYVKETSSGTEYGIIKNPLYPNVTVMGVEAKRPNSWSSREFTVTLPKQPSASDIKLSTDRNVGSFSEPKLGSDGKTWSFVFTNMAGKKITYTIVVTVDSGTSASVQTVPSAATATPAAPNTTFKFTWKPSSDSGPKVGENVSELITYRSLFSGCGLTGVEIGDLWGFVDKNDTLVIPCIYKRVYWFEDGPKLAVVKMSDGNENVIDLKGNLILSQNYDSVTLTSRSAVYAYNKSSDGKQTDFYFDLKGNPITKEEYFAAK